jgi:hypothetical protein
MLRRYASLLIVAVFALVTVGCKIVEPGESAIVVRAEQTQEVAFAILDRYVNWEFENRAVLAEIGPEFRIVGDKIRAKGLDAIESLHRVTVAYKLSRTQEGLADLQTWLSVVEGLQIEAALLLTKGTL